MTLSDRTVLEIDGNNGPYAGATGVFVLREDLEDTEELEHKHIAGNRGQYLSELYRQVGGLSDELGDVIDVSEDADRRAGYHLDGTAGEDMWTITGKTGVDDPDEQWGDGSTDPNDPADASVLDATGCATVTKRDILGGWLKQNRIDSTTPARLYRGEWSDATHADSAGVFGRPVPVVVQDARLQKAGDEPARAEVSITLIRTSKLPKLDDAIDDVVAVLRELVPDY